MGVMLLWFVLIGAAAFGGGYALRIVLSRRSLSGAEAKAKQLLDDAARQAQAAIKQAQLEGKEQFQTLRQDFEKLRVFV